MKFSTAIIGLALMGFGSAYAEELKLELPDPYFGGTPLDYFGSNLEEPNYKPRPAFDVPAGVTNVASGKTVTASVDMPEFGEFSFLVDGDKDYQQKSLLGLDKGVQWIQIDLGAAHTLYALTLWHFHEGDRVYFDIAVRTADDAEFTKNVQTVFNNDHDNSSELGVGTDKEYIESYKSKFIDMKGITGRYVRFYSNGNTSDEFNNYVEAEVFGKLAE
ncbi:MAG: hypothetical protein COA73_13935 [Candidatus Hydrogenedentota bacterium]|nr:MAG: hypothetical protein COA73_13935 [Candidatus Hydrogenedentota bacterium]